MVRFGLGARRSSPGESSSADPSTSSSGSGRAREPPRPVDPVSVTFEGASAFVGEVFYVTDARTGAALTGWPPAPPPRGFRSAERAPDLDGVVRSRDDDEVRAVVALGETRDDDADPLDPNALARSATRAHARRELGASAYFASRELAERWADCVRRPRGLRPDLFLRRRLARPSDVPVTPVGVASRPFGDAYANLCVGWGNPVVAARRGVAADDDQKEAASILLGAARGDGERERAEKGADPDVAGDGHAARLGGLLTGYVGDADACDASLRVADPDDLATWLAPEWERERREDSGQRADARSDANAAGSDPTRAPPSWRTVARRLARRVSDTEDASDAAYDAFAASRSRDVSSGALFENRRHRVDTPVFSSPYVHVVMPADATASFAGKDALGMKLARADANGTLTVTSARAYKPWFFRLEDLAEMIRAAMRVEAANAAARNARRREQAKRTLAALTVAVTNTRPNPKLTGWQIPGLRKRGPGSGAGSGGARGESLFGGGDGDDDDDHGEDDDTPEGIEDESSPADDELMQEYMREMLSDGTAEDALRSWARAASAKASGKSDGGGDGDAHQLNVSPAAHAALVSLVTVCYGWSCVSAAIGNAWDRALCATEIGRWALTMDTPLSDAMDATDVGSFEGLVATSAARAATGNLARRSIAATRARAERLEAYRVEAETDAARREALDARRNEAIARADAILRAVDETRAKAKARRDKRSTETRSTETRSTENQSENHSEDGETSRKRPPRRRRGLFARLSPSNGEDFRTRESDAGSDVGRENRSLSSPSVSSRGGFSADVDPDEETAAEVSRLRGEYDAALREWASIRDELAMLDARRRARDENTASELDAQTEDGDEVRRFAGAVVDALGEAERAKRAVARRRNGEGEGDGGIDSGDGAIRSDDGAIRSEDGAIRSDEGHLSRGNENAVSPDLEPHAPVLAEMSYGAPPMFVGDLRGGVLGDGTQGASGPNGAKIFGWFGSGTVSFVGVGNDASGRGARRG